MFWDGRSVQYQCFDTNGLFAWENRGTLSTEATQLLEEAIANADLDATEPVNHEGGCGASDNGGSTTIWVDDEPLSFAPDCVFEGIASLYAHIQALAFEIQSCESVSMLASVDPDCRAY